MSDIQSPVGDTSLLFHSGLMAQLTPAQQEEATAIQAEKKRLLEKNAKLKKKLAKITDAKKKLQQQELVKAGDRQAQREAWEDAVLQQAATETPEGQDKIAPLSPTGHQIVQLQGQYRRFEIQIKTAEGMMKPLQKNLNSLTEENTQLSQKFAEIIDQVKKQEAHNKDLLHRRKAAEKRAMELQREGLEWSQMARAMPASSGKSRYFRAMRQIMQILEDNQVDPKLVEDIRRMMNQIKVDATYDVNGDSNNSFSSFGASKTPHSQKANRRLLQGSFSSEVLSPTTRSGSSHSGG